MHSVAAAWIFAPDVGYLVGMVENGAPKVSAAEERMGMSVTIDDVKRHVGRFTYKPGWKFDVLHHGDAAEYLSDIFYVIIDNWNDDTHYQQACTLTEVSGMGLDTWGRLFLRHILRFFECERLDRWLKFDGVCCTGPHPK